MLLRMYDAHTSRPFLALDLPSTRKKRVCRRRVPIFRLCEVRSSLEQQQHLLANAHADSTDTPHASPGRLSHAGDKAKPDHIISVTAFAAAAPMGCAPNKLCDAGAGVAPRACGLSSSRARVGEWEGALADGRREGDAASCEVNGAAACVRLGKPGCRLGNFCARRGQRVWARCGWSMGGRDEGRVESVERVYDDVLLGLATPLKG